ncbi:MAG TPA: hypothetical protein VMY78_14120 [Solirubrobacteraceae bacterium]|nr:hypothetical protein [Solirubrobacteraceae bacterium]
MQRPFLLALMAALCVLAGPAGLAHASGRDVLDDCTDDEVMSKTYTQKEYRDALSQLQADADQYGNCREVIRRAQLRAAAGTKKQDTSTTPAAAAGGGDGSSGAIGSAPASEQLAGATPAERAAVEQARTDAAQPALESTNVDTTNAGRAPGSGDGSDVPAPLVVVLAMLLAATLAMAAVRLRSLVNARRV